MLMLIKVNILEKGTNLHKARKSVMTNSICTMFYSFQRLFLYVLSSFLTIKLSRMVTRGIVIVFIGEKAKI